MIHRPACPTVANRNAIAVWLLVCGGICLALPAPGSELRKTAIVKAVERARGAVVNIKGEKTVAVASAQLSRIEPGRRVSGMGTGVIIDPRGYIMTNYHVVDNVREINVTLGDGTHYLARLIARDPETDLAIIKIDPAAPLQVIPIGTSSDLMLGEPVIAVGNAYGYEHTVTRGIVSALHRAVQVSDAQFYEDLIQTDASINPGNSGGPLLNVDGEMIGINVAVRAGAQGIGFAIPVDKAIAVAAELMSSVGAQTSFHGLVGKSNAEGSEGFEVEAVEKQSPAAEAGIRPGDIVIGVGDTPVQRALDFHRAMLDRKAGEEVKLSVKRGQESLTANLTLAGPRPAPKAPSGPTWSLLGLELKPIPPEEFQRFNQSRYRGGLSVTAVRSQSPAAAQGIRRGDVLVGMHIWETISVENVMYILNRPDFASFNPVKFYILRGNETLYGYLPVSNKPTEQR